MTRQFTFKAVVISACSIGFLLSGLEAKAQRYSGAEADKIFKGSTLVVIGEESKIPTMVLMGETTDYKSKTFSELLEPLFKFGEDEKIREYKSTKDYVGFTHHHYQQYYKNVRVEGAEYLMHEKLGRIVSVNGLLFDHISLDTKPKITAKQAVEFAQKDLKAKKYKWESPAEEARLRKMKKDSSATYYPEPELVIACRNMDYKKKEFHVSYKLDLYADEPMSRHWYFVDAMTGEIIAKEDRINTGSHGKPVNGGIRGNAPAPHPAGIRPETPAEEKKEEQKEVPK
jgi:Zn-dependent metalloprotease